jgi:peptidoglycan hydrolase-like protein with peptidoglycan-binding domain
VGGGGATNIPAARAQIIYPDGRVVFVDQMSGESEPSSNTLALGSGTSAAASAGTSVSARFTARLVQGSRGTDVKRLQALLGVEETGYFGPLTRAAVEEFQIKHGIANKGEAGFGTLGPLTRAKVAEVFSGESAVSAPVAGSMAILSGGKFIRGLNLKATGSDVRTLQQVLNSDPDTSIASEGVGSPGKETSYFGSLTQNAVQKFQEKYGIAVDGDAGYGYVGPKTRAKLNEIINAQ